MAEEQQVSSRNKKGGKTGSTANGGKSERGNQNGAERLRRAADRRVGMHSEEIADRLTEKALKGDLASAKELMRLAEGKKPLAKPVKKRRGPGPAVPSRPRLPRPRLPRLPRRGFEFLLELPHDSCQCGGIGGGWL